MIFLQLGLIESVMKNSFLIGFPVLMVAGFHENIITYWGVLGIQWGFRYYRGFQERELHASELKAQLVKAQLSALKMQLQPHFLFNTLNAIMVLVRQQQGRQAEEMLARLSDLLRGVLEDVEAQQMPLRRELEYVRLYLSIEQVRFRIDWAWRSRPTTPRWTPRFLTWACSRSSRMRCATASAGSRGGHIRIRPSAPGQRLTIRVATTGRDCAADPAGGAESASQIRGRASTNSTAGRPDSRWKRRAGRGCYHDHAVSCGDRNFGNRDPCL